MQETHSHIIDNHGRPINYLRLAVTDRCNLRCFYCMPEQGIQFAHRRDLLTYEEMLFLVESMAELGITKVRITGGEPFLRKDMDQFLEALSKIEGIQQISITTNGTLTTRYIPLLKKIGVGNINLSLDTLDRDRFFQITRRDEFDTVWECFQKLLSEGFKVKVNMVVMNDINDQDIISMLELARHPNVSVRYIEEMPFNGDGRLPELVWSYQKIESHIRQVYPEFNRMPFVSGSTTYDYQIPDFKGQIGIIAAYSRTFCGSCNRIRITPKGILKTCLYDKGVFDLKDLLRKCATKEAIKMAIQEACSHRAKDGFEAERSSLQSGIPLDSMTTIGG